MQVVVVEFPTGRIFRVQVGDNATVLDLKIALYNQENLPGDPLSLQLDRGDGIIMNDDQVRLRAHGVRDGTRLYALIKPLEAENNDDDYDTGDDKVLDKDRTESETEEEKGRYDSDDDSSSSTPKTPSEDTTVESPLCASGSSSD